MARFAIIDAGRVTNIIEAEQDFADAIGAVPAGIAGIGWLWSGTDFAPPPAPVPTIADFDAALTAHLDATAQARRYDNRITCMVRAGFPGPFQAEGVAFATWCDTCNAMAYTLLAEVQAGTRPLPATTQALIDTLPEIEWPT